MKGLVFTDRREVDLMKFSDLSHPKESRSGRGGPAGRLGALRATLAKYIFSIIGPADEACKLFDKQSSGKGIFLI